MVTSNISTTIMQDKDPLKIEVDNIKQEEDIGDDPLKLEEILQHPIKTEPSFDSSDHSPQSRNTYEKKYKCDKCKSKFAYLFALTAHSKKIHEKKKLDFHKCDFCDVKSKNLVDIKTHIKNVHQGLDVPQCRVCNQCFNHKSQLEEHIEIKHEGKIPKCEICVKDFSTRHSLDQHVNIYHNGNNICFKCKLCNKVYKGKNSKYSLEDHIKTIHEKIKHKCKLCCQEYSNKSALRRHVSVRHEGKRAYKCDNCNKQFGYHHSLKNHFETTHNDLKLECSMCNSIFTSTKSLSFHIGKYHDSIGLEYEKTVFECDICEKRFMLSYRLRIHFQSAHTRLRKFKCEHCEKQFRAEADVRKHISRLHKKSEDSKVKCPLCNSKRLYFPHYLKIHMKFCKGKLRKNECMGMSNKEKYTCQICPKKFKFLFSLTNHFSKKHLKKLEKSLKCDFCEETLKDMSSMWRHFRIRHYRDWKRMTISS